MSRHSEGTRDLPDLMGHVFPREMKGFPGRRENQWGPKAGALPPRARSFAALGAYLACAGFPESEPRGAVGRPGAEQGDTAAAAPGGRGPAAAAPGAGTVPARGAAGLWFLGRRGQWWPEESRPPGRVGQGAGAASGTPESRGFGPRPGCVREATGPCFSLSLNISKPALD